MLLPKVLVLIAVLLPMVISTADVGNRKKRAVNYAVEGCSSEFPGAGKSRSIPTSDVKTRAEIKITYWLRQEAINVSVEISILKAKKWTTANALPDADRGQPVMDHKAAVVDKCVFCERCWQH